MMVSSCARRFHKRLVDAGAFFDLTTISFLCSFFDYMVRLTSFLGCLVLLHFLALSFVSRRTTLYSCFTSFSLAFLIFPFSTLSFCDSAVYGFGEEEIQELFPFGVLPFVPIFLVSIRDFLCLLSQIWPFAVLFLHRFPCLLTTVTNVTTSPCL
jgi:hypothetical protein